MTLLRSSLPVPTRLVQQPSADCSGIASRHCQRLPTLLDATLAARSTSTYEIELGSSLILKRKKYKPAELKPVASDKFSIDDFSQGDQRALTAVTLRFSQGCPGQDPRVYAGRH